MAVDTNLDPGGAPFHKLDRPFDGELFGPLIKGFRKSTMLMMNLLSPLLCHCLTGPSPPSLLINSTNEMRNISEWRKSLQLSL